MRWLTLYIRSRQVPAALAATLIGVAAVWWSVHQAGGGAGDPRPEALALVTGAAAAASGLGGQDAALDRSAAIRWAPRRAAHVLLLGTLVGAVLLAVQATGGDGPSAAGFAARVGFAVRDSAGLAGLVALGAAAWGGSHAWTLPVGWFSLAFFVPPSDGAAVQAARWMLLPDGTQTGTWTASLLAVTGTTVYALAGPRR